MKKLNQMIIEVKDAKSYFIANDILNLSFNFMDKHLGYTTDTIKGDIDNKKLTMNLTFTNSETYKLREVLELLETLDLLANEEQEEEKED